MSYLLGLAAVLLFAGLILWWAGRRLFARTGLPAGEVIYSDTGAWEKVEAPLISRRYGLVGKPDYLVRAVVAGEKVCIPVEVKSRKRPQHAPQNHQLQLATYCLLVEDQEGKRPPFGLLRYADGTMQVAYTDDLRRQVLAAAEGIRKARTAASVLRQHQDAARCQGCGYRHGCGEEALEG